VVSGFGPTAGAALASHMDVDKVYAALNIFTFSFTVISILTLDMF
jgi:hypothetical protein